MQVELNYGRCSLPVELPSDLGSAEFVEAQRRLIQLGSNDSAVLDSVAASADPAVAIIPEGPYVVPFYESS